MKQLEGNSFVLFGLWLNIFGKMNACSVIEVKQGADSYPAPWTNTVNLSVWFDGVRNRFFVWRQSVSVSGVFPGMFLVCIC